MLNKLFPRRIDNTFRGYRIALVLFGLIAALRMLQSVMILANPYGTITGADGIPLDAYAADAAQTVVSLFAQLSLWRLIVSLISVVVLVRYRAAVPLMFVVYIAIFLGGQILSQFFVTLVRTGTTTGQIVNRVLFGLMLVGLVLSLIERRRSGNHAVLSSSLTAGPFHR